MKKILIPFFVIYLFLSTSCTKEYPTRFGFYCPVEKNSSGLTIMAVSSRAAYIHLDGYVSVHEGDVVLTLTDPDGVLVFSKLVESGENLRLNQTFKAVPGLWKLRYKSVQGTGSMDIHMNS